MFSFWFQNLVQFHSKPEKNEKLRQFITKLSKFKLLQLISLSPKNVPIGYFTSKIHSIVHYRLEGLQVSKYISWKGPDHNIKLQYKYQIDVEELFLLQKDKKENKCYVSKPNSIWSITVLKFENFPGSLILRENIGTEK